MLTGFLGAGKTTLLNRLLQDPALAQAAVIINEFGEIGVDHLLVEHVDDGVMLLSTGCLCCTMRGDLIDTLEKLLRGLDNGRMNFNRVIIETTGFADPAPVLHTAMVHPYLLMRFRLDGVVTVVDAVNGVATLDAHIEAVKQVAVADRIVLTKTDLAGSRGRAGCRTARAAEVAQSGGAGDRGAQGGAAQLDRLRALRSRAQDPRRERWLADEAYVAAHDDHHHHHDVNRHDDRIRAFSLASEQPSRTRRSRCSSIWCARCTGRSCCA